MPPRGSDVVERPEDEVAGRDADMRERQRPRSPFAVAEQQVEVEHAGGPASPRSPSERAFDPLERGQELVGREVGSGEHDRVREAAARAAHRRRGEGPRSGDDGKTGSLQRVDRGGDDLCRRSVAAVAAISAVAAAVIAVTSVVVAALPGVPLAVEALLASS